MEDGAALDQLLYSHQIHPRPGQQSVYISQMSICLHEIQHRPKIEGFNNDIKKKKKKG